jgi:hypothetical protein
MAVIVSNESLEEEERSKYWIVEYVKQQITSIVISHSAKKKEQLHGVSQRLFHNIPLTITFHETGFRDM